MSSHEQQVRASTTWQIFTVCFGDFYDLHEQPVRVRVEEGTMATIGHLAKSKDPKIATKNRRMLQNYRQQLECENPCNKESWCAQTKR